MVEKASRPASGTRTPHSPCLCAPSLAAAPCWATLGKPDNLSEPVLLHSQTGAMPWRLAVRDAKDHRGDMCVGVWVCGMCECLLRQVVG